MAGDKSGCCIVGGKKIAIIFTVGILLAVAGVILYVTMDRFIQNKINERLVLKPGSEVYKQWKEPSVPIYLQFFLFDVVNPEEAKQGAKPYLVQRGPFSYREHRPKKNITWNKSSASVAYNEEMTFVFDPETSCGSCDPSMSITTVNIPLVTLAEAARNLPVVVRVFISTIFDDFKEQFFMTRRVHDVLWGYREPLFSEYNKLRNEVPKGLRHFLPEISPIIALQHNKTTDGVTTVHTGEKDIAKLVQYKAWKGLTELKVWNTSYANMINGTDGSQFAPEVGSEDTLYVFVTQLCRSLYLTHTENSNIEGIDALQFAIPAEVFLNASLNHDNRGFCTKKCYPSGILDIGVCQPPSPIAIPLFVSAPHFYLGDPSLREPVDGLSPNKEEHGTILNVEPHTGISIKSSKRLQINVKVEPVSWISEMTGIGNMFFPVFYINETATLDTASAKQLKSEVLSKFMIVHGIELGLVILGGLLILIACILLIMHIRHNRKLKTIRMKVMLNGDSSERSPLLHS